MALLSKLAIRTIDPRKFGLRTNLYRDPDPYQKTEPRAGLEARGVPERPQCTCDPQGLGGEGPLFS